MGNKACTCLNSVCHKDAIDNILRNNTTMDAEKGAQKNRSYEQNSNMSTIAETPALVGIPDEHTQNIANRIAYLNLVLYN